jgi:hypothetical protein
MHIQLLTLRRHRLIRSCVLTSLGMFVAGATLAACAGPLGGPPPAKRDCGAIHQGATVTQSDPNAESCFAQAYTSCRPATLEYTFMGVDAGSVHTFTAAPGTFGGCTISDMVQSYVVPTNHQTTHTYTCTGLQHKDGGLLITGCGSEGDVFIPPASAT